jgi:hypothetical protein
MGDRQQLQRDRDATSARQHELRLPHDEAAGVREADAERLLNEPRGLVRHDGLARDVRIDERQKGMDLAISDLRKDVADLRANKPRSR